MGGRGIVLHGAQIMGRVDVDRSDQPSTVIHLCARLGLLVVVLATDESHRVGCIASHGGSGTR